MAILPLRWVFPTKAQVKNLVSYIAHGKLVSDSVMFDPSEQCNIPPPSHHSAASFSVSTVAASLVLAYATWIFVVVPLSETFNLLENFKPVKKITVSFPKEAEPGWSEGDVMNTPGIRDSKDPQLIRCYDPTTGRTLRDPIRASTPDEVKAIVARARAAQASYAQVPFETRRAILRSLLDFTVREQHHIVQVCVRDSGKTRMCPTPGKFHNLILMNPEVDAWFGEVLVTCEKLRWTILNGERSLKREYRSPGLMTIYKRAYVEYVPVGVMGCVVSWNYPFHNSIGPVISALMAGNATVVKCSEQVAWSCGFWESLVHAALAAHGISKDLVRFVNGYAETGAALVESVDKVIFIGSPGIGKVVMRHASATLTPVVLELGGKDPAIVFEDADLEQIVHSTLRTAFQNAGQNCAGLERVIVHKKIYDMYVHRVAKYIQHLRVGPALEEEVDVGALVLPGSLEKLERLVQDAVKKGARLICGGRRYVHPRYPKGQYFEPTLLVDVRMDMEIAHEEVFGPVMVVYEFSTEEEAIAMANGCGFGLGSGVFTADLARGRRVVNALQTGMSNINDFGTNYLVQGMPFGGIKQSGFDRFAGIEGLRGQCYLKSITEDRVAVVKTAIPKPLEFPLTKRSRVFMDGLMRLLYAYEPASTLGGLWTVLMSMMK
ncbi:Aldehyde/histidinol dehydrogenase [Cladochytrium replicatum]|nr:Aldehyde/histidinol dehydrogenase [Cladochytrium replicatum]